LIVKTFLFDSYYNGFLQSSITKCKEILSKNECIQIRRSVIRKFQNLKLLNTEEGIMDFIQASEKTKYSVKVRRKSWKEGHNMWWSKKYQCMLAAHPYRVQEKYLDTDGYIYVCEGDDVEATDWEDFC